MTKSTLSKAQSKKLINDLFHAIPYQVQSGSKLAKDHLQELCLAAEKNHRKGAYSSHYNFPVGDTAKFFVVQYLFNGMQVAKGVTKGYDITAILHIRLECLIAQAYAMENTGKLQEWYQTVVDSNFATLDYCDLIA
jgi:hypothetical protein